LKIHSEQTLVISGKKDQKLLKNKIENLGMEK
jgi:hypothetical protein